MWEEEAQLSTVVVFEAYDGPLEMVIEFKYLGRILTELEDDWPAVVKNLLKVRKRWEQLSQILGWEGEESRTYGTFYKVVVQANLLFGVETWVVSHIIRKNYGGFHHRVARHLAGMRPGRDMMGRWVYPLMYAVLSSLGLEEVEPYVLHQKNTIAQYIATCTILELWLAAERQPGGAADLAVV